MDMNSHDIAFKRSNRHLIVLLFSFVGRDLTNNQLKELPKGVFDHNTRLWGL